MVSYVFYGRLAKPLASNIHKCVAVVAVRVSGGSRDILLHCRLKGMGALSFSRQRTFFTPIFSEAACR